MSRNIVFSMVPLFFTFVLFGCADNIDGSKSQTRITDRTWGGACVDATQGSQRAVIAFSAGQISVRTFLYTGSNVCDTVPRHKTSATTAEYEIVGSNGFETKINITNIRVGDGREESKHMAVIPRDFDIYYIENNYLYFGDYTNFSGNRENDRPVSYSPYSSAVSEDVPVEDVF